MNITININEAVWQNRVDKINAERKASHDAAQARKPEEERVEYVPQTVEGYLTARIAGIEADYAQQIEHEELETVRADPVQYARLMKALTNPELRQQLSDIIDAAQV